MMHYNFTSFRSQSEYSSLIRQRSYQRPRVVRGQQAVRDLQEAVVCSVLLPRGGAGAAAVRPARMEYPLRV